jgi:murein DD-endopeptidase MepM/ murein hydrolase activator NlpD
VSRTRAVTIVLLVALVAAVLPSFAVAQQAEQRQLQQARDRLASLAQDLDRASTEASDRDEELADADRRLREVEAVVNEVAAAVDRQQGAVMEAERRLEAVEAEAEEVFDAFADRAARMYKEGPNLSFQVLLSSDDALAAMSRTSYLRVATQADRASLEALDAAQTAVDAERERLQQEQDRLEGMLAEQQELLAQAQQIRESRALAAANARAEVERLTAERDDLEAEQEALQALIRQRQEEARQRAEAERRAAEREAAERAAAEREAAERAAAEEQASTSGGSTSDGGNTSSAPSSSGFAWPLCAPVTSEYGPRWGRMHRGIDQGASTGTPIGASKAGTVIFAGWQGGYGNLTLIDHHDGVVTAYAHQSRFAVTSGSVSQGQTIGYVGNTGNSTGPHLHFETRVNGRAVNPRQYLPGSPC